VIPERKDYLAQLRIQERLVILVQLERMDLREKKVRRVFLEVLRDLLAQQATPVLLVLLVIPDTQVLLVLLVRLVILVIPVRQDLPVILALLVP
jgi:hypothetical protein